MTRQAATVTSIFEDEKFAWLDKVAEPVQQAAQRVFQSGPLGMKIKSVLNGTPFHHRVHPALIAVPIGSWSAALLLDVLDARHGRSSLKRQSGYRQGADTCVTLGLISTLPTAAAGLADWVDTSDHQRRVGMAHALLNTTALALYGASLALRLSGSNQRGLARALSGLGYSAVAAGGALGGELVYNLGVNVPFLLQPRPPVETVDVLASEDLPERTPKVVQVGHVPVLLMRDNGQIYAVQDWCPHAGGSLSEGTFEGEEVECPWHQSRFCLSNGKATQGPASAPLRTFETFEEDGRIKVRPSYEAQAWPPPPPTP